jgi:hypothetical protein
MQLPAVARAPGSPDVRGQTLSKSRELIPDSGLHNLHLLGCRFWFLQKSLVRCDLGIKPQRDAGDSAIQLFLRHQIKREQIAPMQLIFWNINAGNNMVTI